MAETGCPSMAAVPELVTRLMLVIPRSLSFVSSPGSLTPLWLVSCQDYDQLRERGILGVDDAVVVGIKARKSRDAAGENSCPRNSA